MIIHGKIQIDPLDEEDVLSGKWRKVCIEVLDGPLKGEVFEEEFPINHPIFDVEHKG